VTKGADSLFCVTLTPCDLFSGPCAIDAKGHLLVTRQAFSGPHSCVLLTVLATCLKPPAHLDPCKGPGSVPCEMDSLRSDLGRLLMSAGDEADVALQCAGGESIRAHSQVGNLQPSVPLVQCVMCTTQVSLVVWDTNLLHLL
jgi:hypothetical protein